MLLLLLIIVFCIFPFYWMVTTSLKTQLEALASPPSWIFEPTFANYNQVLFKDNVGQSLVNSLIVAVCTTALALILGTPAAYALVGSNSAARKIFGSGLSQTEWSAPSCWRCRSF